MNKHLFLLAFLFIWCRSAEPRLSAQPLPIAGAQPILVVMEQNPWLMVIGSDSPVFALYDDGTIVYSRENATADTPFQFRTVPDAAGISKALLAFDPADMKSKYVISPLDHDPTTIIWTPTRRVVIYGDWRNMPEIDSSMLDMEDDSDIDWKARAEMERKNWAYYMKMWESLPNEIRETLLRIDRERSIEGRSWLPPTVEVMLWPYEYAPGESIIWPEGWPGLYAKETRKRGAESYSVYLPSQQLPELRSFLATEKDKGAVLIDGQKMAADIRFPFPGEDAWMR